MATTFRDTRQFFNALANMGEKLRTAIIPLTDLERTQLVTRVVREADMVFGVWPDDDQPEGFGVQVIKGTDLMPPLEEFEFAEEVTVAAIPCVGLEPALAARDEWGRMDDEVIEAQDLPRVALAVAEVARQVWVAARRSNDGGYPAP